ncbi:MAG: type II secretion system major pseudopilin GspG [Tatlockia sp.]|nr:type II secretion system major pseudopilin GspG [Tatlockia sp.]
MKIKKKLEQGITSIELLLAFMLIMLVASILYALLVSEKKEKIETPLNKQNQDILIIKNALKFYKLDNGFYPTTAQGLEALVVKPTREPIPKRWVKYLERLPLDPWGKNYQYYNLGKYIEIEALGLSVKPKKGQFYPFCTKKKYELTNPP